MDTYKLALLVVGVIVMAAAVLPRWVAGRAVSYPIVYLAAGAVLFSLPLGLPAVDPLAHGDVVEHLTEFVIIVAIMSCGLKIDLPFSWSGWRPTWRLLAVTMPLSIVLVALLGLGFLGLHPAAALLLGAVLAPTDPVLASDVQLHGPGGGHDDDPVRFGLTSEAGLNDGLAFPFVNAAVLMALEGVSPGGWLGEWVAVDVLYRIAAATLIGAVVGRVLARFVFSRSAETPLAETMEGSVVLGVTLLSFAVTELAKGYGFVAVFVTACVLRGYEREHEYHKALHQFAEEIERIVMAVVVVLLGGAIVHGLLTPLPFAGWLLVAAVIVVVRPVGGWVGLTGSRLLPMERGAIAFFGIRGIGSLYYLSHGLNTAPFAEADLLWSVVGAVVAVSIVVHGVTASPVLDRLDRHRDGVRG
jgi:NhaP-type Na+/H+ or K+/H+ antiporter